MEVWGWVLLLVAVAALIGTFFVIRRRRYLAAVAERGWSHDRSPALESVLDHRLPPFGLGLSREVDELITGTTPAGFPFRAFEYGYRGAGARYQRRLVSVKVPGQLPEAFLAGSAGHRVGLSTGGALVELSQGPISVVGSDQAALVPVMATGSGPLAALLTAGFDVSLDGDAVVVAGVPKDPQDLADLLAALDPAVADLARIATGPAPVRPPAFSFHGHPQWSYLGSEPGVLNVYPVTGGGYDHEVKDLVSGLRDGIRTDGFEHHWKTTRVEVHTDSQGRMQTRTVTDYHQEPMLGFTLPFSVPAISLNGQRLGERVRFESADFDRAFVVRSENPRFASDITHPRMMEWLLGAPRRGWSVSGRVVWFEVEDHDTLIMDSCESVLWGWLGRFPRFVWDDLGVEAPPFLVE